MLGLVVGASCTAVSCLRGVLFVESLGVVECRGARWCGAVCCVACCNVCFDTEGARGRTYVSCRGCRLHGLRNGAHVSCLRELLYFHVPLTSPHLMPCSSSFSPRCFVCSPPTERVGPAEELSAERERESRLPDQDPAAGCAFNGLRQQQEGAPPRVVCVAQGKEGWGGAWAMRSRVVWRSSRSPHEREYEYSSRRAEWIDENVPVFFSVCNRDGELAVVPWFSLRPARPPLVSYGGVIVLGRRSVCVCLCVSVCLCVWVLKSLPSRHRGKTIDVRDGMGNTWEEISPPVRTRRSP